MNTESEKEMTHKTIVLKVEKPMWQAIRKIAFDNEISMNQLIRHSINEIINRQKNLLTGSTL